MREPYLRTVFADLRTIDHTIMVRYEFEEKTPYDYMESELTAVMPQRLEIDLFIPVIELRRHGALKMAEVYTQRAWYKACAYFNTHPRYVNTSNGAYEVGELLANPRTKPYHRMMVQSHRSYPMRVVENPYLSPYSTHIVSESPFSQRYMGIFPPMDIDDTINDALEYMNGEMEKFMGGFAATTTCSNGKETALTLETMEKALETLGVPCHGKRGSHTLYIGNGTDKVQKYNTKGGKMPYLSKIAKKLLDADTKTLIKAGYLDGELDLTQEGVNELMEILFMANKPAMVAAAKAKIKEEKENDE